MRLLILATLSVIVVNALVTRASLAAHLPQYRMAVPEKVTFRVDGTSQLSISWIAADSIEELEALRPATIPVFTEVDSGEVVPGAILRHRQRGSPFYLAPTAIEYSAGEYLIRQTQWQSARPTSRP